MGILDGCEGWGAAAVDVVDQRPEAVPKTTAQVNAELGVGGDEGAALWQDRISHGQLNVLACQYRRSPGARALIG